MVTLDGYYSNSSDDGRVGQKLDMGSPMSATRRRTVVGLGELLWDLLPEGPRLGGAPANFAVMAGRLGDRAVVASRVGADVLGAQAREKLRALPVECGFLQTDDELPTGTVTVALEGGEPRYTIHEPAAWDRLELTASWRELAAAADAVCWGTLAQRETRSRETIRGFLAGTRPDCVRVLDVNRRAPFWSADVLRDSLDCATVVKLNGDEYPEALRASGASSNAEPGMDDEEMVMGARRLMERYSVRIVCVTLGERGSLLVTREEWHRHTGRAVVMRDSVGAGDAFTAALVHYALRDAALEMLNEAGNRWGGWVASQPGAMPELTDEVLAEMAEGLGAG